MSKKIMNLLLCLALVAALSLMCVLFLRYRSLGTELSDLQARVDTSISAWKKTDAEKQDLQKERDELKDSLKEAKLSLTEAQDRAESFREDIKSLEQEIGELRAKLPSND